MITPTLPPPDRAAAKDAIWHFVAAYTFFLVGLVLLVWNSPRLAAGNFTDLRVLGGIHFITLGWLTLSIFGALRVFTGVALGHQGGSRSMIPWARSFWVLGVAAFPLGLMITSPLFIAAGLIFITAGLLLYTIYLAPALFRANRGSLTRWYLVVALSSLWLALFLGAGAALTRVGHPLWLQPPGYFQAHILIAIFGWVGSVVVGVGSHLIPMFALSKDTNSWPVKAALLFWSLIPVMGLLAALLPGPYIALGWSAAAAGSLLWFAQVVLYFRNRLRKEKDAGLFLAFGATVILIFGWGAGLVLKAPVAFIGLALVGWLTLFTLGIYHRVIPFLAWFARYATGAGKGRVPKVKELTSDALAMATAVSALIGAPLWGVGILTHQATLTYAGSALLLLSAFMAAGQCRWLIGQPRRTKSPQLPFMNHGVIK